MALIGEEEAAVLIGCKVSKLKSNRYKKHGLPYIRSGRTVFYDLDTVNKYIENNNIEFSIIPISEYKQKQLRFDWDI